MWEKHDQHHQLTLLVAVAKRVLALTDDHMERYRIIDALRDVQKDRYRADESEVRSAVNIVEHREKWADEIRAEQYRDDEKCQRRYPFPPYDPKPEKP